MNGIGLVIFPTSWHFGPWDLPHKWLFAVGPLRFVYHKNVKGEWRKPRVHSLPRGEAVVIE